MQKEANFSERELLTVRETAGLLGLHPNSVRRMLKEGRMPGVRLGPKHSAVRIDRQELARWLYEGPGAA